MSAVAQVVPLLRPRVDGGAPGHVPGPQRNLRSSCWDHDYGMVNTKESIVCVDVKVVVVKMVDEVDVFDRVKTSTTEVGEKTVKGIAGRHF